MPYTPREPHPARWLFSFYIFCFRIFSHLLSRILRPISSLSHTISHIFYPTSSIRHLLSSIFYLASSITYRLSHIFYHVSSISHLPFRISHLNFSFRICICILRFEFAFFVLHFASCIKLYTYSGFHTLSCSFEFATLHTEYHNTSIDMSHSNPEQFASTAMPSARSRLLELPNEASIGLSPTT